MMDIKKIILDLSKSFIIASKFIDLTYTMFVKIKKLLCKLSNFLIDSEQTRSLEFMCRPPHVD